MSLKKVSLLLGVAALSFLALNGSCHDAVSSEANSDSTRVNLDNVNFQDNLNGKTTKLYLIKNGPVKACFTSYGARLVGLWVPDKNGVLTDVVLGFAHVQDYARSAATYYGATIGRYGNRIAKGRFAIKGKQYQLTLNNGPNTLHGGKNGFQRMVWNAVQPDEKTVVFTYRSEDGEEGFPGNLNVKVTYSLTGQGGLKMEYEATTDRPTVVNLTNHAFFNLNGEGGGKILAHKVTIYADRYTPVDSTLIPTGQLAPVAGTPFDFTVSRTIGAHIHDDHIQLKNAKGYDHNFVLSGTKKNGMLHAARVTGDRSGICMDIYTEEPGLQFYSGNFMKGINTCKNGSKDAYRTGFAMETQHFPDSPNQPSFPSTLLNPGETYHTTSIYRFSVAK